jgi:hypothetical protein
LHHVEIPKKIQLCWPRFLLCSENVPIPGTSQQDRIGDRIYSLLYMCINKRMRAIGTCSCQTETWSNSICLNWKDWFQNILRVYLL